MSKIQKFPISTLKDESCPFHVTDEKGKKYCFFKYLTTSNVMSSIFEENTKITNTEWNKDCDGKWNNCTILSLLYTFDEQKEETEEVEEVVEKQYIDSHLNDYDPFNNEEEEEAVSEIIQETTFQVTQEENEDTEDEQDTEEEYRDILNEKDISLSIHKLNPYRVKCDVLVYPNNQALAIDDAELNKRTGLRVSKECQKLVQTRSIKLGSVYTTSNGNKGDIVPGGVAAKKIYHAVVAGASRLVAPKIDVVTTRALLMAEAEGAKTVAIMPFDCGDYDVEETARLQLIGIRKFVTQTQNKCIEKIYICIPDDQDGDMTVEAFEQHFDRIF